MLPIQWGEVMARDVHYKEHILKRIGINNTFCNPHFTGYLPR